jgi:hypothetical protein
MELQLSTLDQVLLIITTSAITLFFLLGIAALIVSLVLVSKIKKLVAKAEDAVNSVEEATETIKNIGAQAGGPLAIFKIIKNVYDVVNRKK